MMIPPAYPVFFEILDTCCQVSACKLMVHIEHFPTDQDVFSAEAHVDIF